MGICSDCGAEVSQTRRGMCDNDYRRWLRSSKPKKPAKIKPIEARLDSKTEKSENCWIWTGSYDGTGYGKVLDPSRKRLVPAHRASYEVHVGEIPDGLEIDHLCRNKGCINPSHLEPVTPVENVRRALPFVTRRNGLKERCPKGHPYDEENTRWYARPDEKRPSRYCRACDRLRFKRRTADHRQAGA